VSIDSFANHGRVLEKRAVVDALWFNQVFVSPPVTPRKMDIPTDALLVRPRSGGCSSVPVRGTGAPPRVEIHRPGVDFIAPANARVAGNPSRHRHNVPEDIAQEAKNLSTRERQPIAYEAAVFTHD
jgi:hypothetical protein